MINMHGTEDERLRADVRNELDAEFAARTRSEWKDALENKEAMFGVVRYPKEALLGSSFTERGVVPSAEREDAPSRVGFPARSSAGFHHETGSAPAHGEHPRTILQEHGFGDG
jgi:crotonobetainyl-CoA:carnitine CoA-transferase CaiB-like acyl-CoA transferase